MPDQTDFYARLGLSPDATEEDIRKAYRAAARKLHPDVNSKDGATELFINMKEAFEALIDPRQRAAYDEKRPTPPPPPVRLNKVFSRDTLSALDAPQLIYALIELDILVDASKTDDNTPINLTLVLDCSTSMKGERLDQVKVTAIELLQRLRPQDIISIISFNDRAEVLIPAGPRPAPHKAESRIRMMQARGSTQIYDGLNAGYIQAQQFLRPEYSNHLLLVTDGHTYGDEAACIALANQAADAGIVISTLGIGSDWNDKFLDQVAKATGGSSVFVSSPKDIGAFFKEKLEYLGKSFVERVEMNLRLAPNVKLTYAFRLTPEVGALPTEMPVHLGGIPYQSRQRILLEFLVDPLPEDISRVVLAEGRFSFTIPTYSTNKYRLPITLLRPVSNDGHIEPPPHSIVEAMSKLTLYRMQEKVQDNVTHRNFEAAAQGLQNMATHLLAQGELDLAKTALLEVHNIRKQQQLSQEGQKQIKYGTRALLLPSGNPKG